MSPRRSRRGDAAILFLLIIAGIAYGVVYVVTAIAEAVAEHWVLFSVFVIIVGGASAALFMSVRHNRQIAAAEDQARWLAYEQQLHERISRVQISDQRSDYVISNEDYRRGTPRENFYRRTFFLPLLSVFGNRCAGCGNAQNGVDVDHFVFSKNAGGSFAMYHNDGLWVNNAIPLCETCNRSKLDRSYAEFFTEEQLIEIFEKNVQMTKLLNDSASMAQFRPGMSAPARVRPRRHTSPYSPGDNAG